MLTTLKQHVLETGETITQEVELTFQGETRCYRESIEPVRDRTGRIIGVIGAATDLSEEKQTREALHRAVELRDRVISVLGHDLRNPLHALALAATTLRERTDLPNELQRSFASFRRPRDG